MTPANPTKRAYTALNEAYDFFNKRLFAGTLPRCLITMQRKGKVYGYFAGARFGSPDGAEVTDEIALNPAHFRTRAASESLATLVHEMVHLWQHHCGKPGRTSYHNKQWAEKMHDVGLVPSDTGTPGGKETGQSVSHYIAGGGPFDRACTDLLARGFAVPYVELWGDSASRKKKAASKTRYTCPACQANAWGKPGLSLICGDCEVAFEAEEQEPED